MILGGGGYTIENVARCWTYETGLCVNNRIDAEIPESDAYFQQYGPDYKLHYQIKANVDNKNSREDLYRIEEFIYEYLRRIESAPSVAFHDIPQVEENELEDEWDPDLREEMSLEQFEGNGQGHAKELEVTLGNGQLIHKRE